MKRLLLGNEALALGAYAAGVSVGTGYPGTPSTEILERFARFPDVYAEWSPNEKVALEVGMGAALAGARTIVTMKHVGLNVAADPFFAASYMGVVGGLVVISADDPGMHSSQGEQDNRNYAKFAKVPLLEPSDSQECFDMVRIGLEMSEAFDTPVLLRTTGRISHAQSLVEVDAQLLEGGRRMRQSPLAFRRNPEKYVMLPANARRRRLVVEERLGKLQEYSESTPLNYIRWGERRLGVVSGSMAYQYAREVFPRASFLKLGMAYPLPRRLIVEFARQVDTLLIVEELDPFIEEQIRALPDLPPVRVLGKDVFPAYGEFSSELVAQCALQGGLLSEADLRELGFGLSRESVSSPVPTEIRLPPRAPVLCPGCGHRATFDALRRMLFQCQDDLAVPHQSGNSPYGRALLERQRQYRVVVNGDIGCYTLGALQPLYAMDTCSCMGASIGHALGMEKAGIKNKVVAVIGDGTFFHSGITGLVDVLTSGAATTVIILDNGTTAMTGGNANPGSGLAIGGRPARRLDLESLCRGLGVEDVVVVDAYDYERIERELRRAVYSDAPTVIIVKFKCRVQERSISPLVSWVEEDKCVGCWACLALGCPALTRRNGHAEIVPGLCADCQVCNHVCPHNAIVRVEREKEQVKVGA